MSDELNDLRLTFIRGRTLMLDLDRPQTGGTLAACRAQAEAEWARVISLAGRPAEPAAPFNPLTSPVVLLDVSAGRPESEWQKDLYTHARLGYRFAGTIKAHTGDYVVMQVPEDR